MRSLMVFILTILLVSCGEPISMIPGGELSGQVQAPPPDWSDIPETIQVETRPSNPYSINIWSVAIGHDLYISTGAGGTTWSEFIKSDSRVRTRVGTSLYKLNAVSVSDAAERSRVVSAYVARYDLDKDDNWVQAGLIFRLDRR